MILALMLIIAGILIAIYPPLLSAIVATILIMTGIVLLIIRYQIRKLSREWDNPFIEFFLRF